MFCGAGFSFFFAGAFVLFTGIGKSGTCGELTFINGVIPLTLADVIEAACLYIEHGEEIVARRICDLVDPVFTE